ncbi:MAG: DUF192 domain-containing protein [Patescibacteria group bacterium]
MFLSTRRVIIFALVIIILILLGIFELLLVNNLKKEVRYLLHINDQAISVELADTAAERYKGLSQRNDLCADCGLLFVFPKKEVQDFVMRDMKFSLDIIFIADNKIVKIVSSAPPEGSDPQIIYSSDEAVDYVLELTGDYARKNNLRVGDRVYGLHFK